MNTLQLLDSANNVVAVPRISVVMPSFNQAPFIDAAVRSVLTQDVDGIELVVMDGGSTDGTLAQLAALSAQFPGKLRWFSGPDDGPADAIHRAVLASRSPVIGWVNSDDLYFPGALARALSHLAAHPEHVMVYGEARHVDAEGEDLGAYPTDPPSTPVAMFADGCFICQPSVVFRRSAYDAVGGLDRSLRASFDFDLWMKFFLAFPGGIGFLREVQAGSRLHGETITSRQRERVAREGIRVLHRHLGSAPGHWLLTHLDELCTAHPFHPKPLDLSAHMAALVEEMAPMLNPGASGEVLRRVAADRRVALSTPQFAAAVHADGWAGDVFDLRILQGAALEAEAPITAVRMTCRVAGAAHALSLQVVLPDGESRSVEVVGQGLFELNIPVDDKRPGAKVLLRVLCANPFVPAECEPGSTDTRRLAFLVEGCELLTSG